MTIQVGDILRVVAIMSWLDGDIMQNVFNAVISGSGGPYDEDDIVADALTWVEAMYAEIVTGISTSVDGSEIRVYVYDSVEDDWDEIGSDAWVWNPSQGGEELARGVASLINAKTSNPDVNGKKYLGGVTQPSCVDGLFTPALIILHTAFAGEWLTAFVGSDSLADWVPGIWSPTRTNFYAASGVAILPTIPAYQRRRKQGVGI